jgi:hypothetical protein
MAINSTIKLPPLPGSDPESIARNTYSGFYGVGSRDFWKDADVSLHKLEDSKICDHYFEKVGSEVQCKKCRAGYVGPGISAENGKLLINNMVTGL